MIFTTTVYSIIKIRFGLADHRREGASITLSPDGRLAASTDEFGRIMLMSMKDRIVLRSWKGWLFVIIYYTRLCPKWTNYSIIFFYYVNGFFISGYRDAECAWVPVQEEHHDHNSELMHPRRTALFLVIYAPRRGILEVRKLCYYFWEFLQLLLQRFIVKGLDIRTWTKSSCF